MGVRVIPRKLYCNSQVFVVFDKLLLSSTFYTRMWGSNVSQMEVEVSELF